MPFHFIPTLAISLNEDLLFFLVFGIFALIKYLSSRKKGEDVAPPPENDAEQARRTREIQEEIRRRVAANRTHTPAPAAEPKARPVSKPSVMLQEQVLKEARLRPDRAETEAANRSANLLQQLAAAEKLEAETHRKAVAAKAEYMSRAKNVPQVSAYHTEIETMLHNPSGIRDAVILSEILSAPVSERKASSCLGLQ
jgi:hypothetical protein